MGIDVTLTENRPVTMTENDLLTLIGTSMQSFHNRTKKSPAMVLLESFFNDNIVVKANATIAQKEQIIIQLLKQNYDDVPEKMQQLYTSKSVHYNSFDIDKLTQHIMKYGVSIDPTRPDIFQQTRGSAPAKKAAAIIFLNTFHSAKKRTEKNLTETKSVTPVSLRPGSAIALCKTDIVTLIGSEINGSETDLPETARMIFFKFQKSKEIVCPEPAELLQHILRLNAADNKPHNTGAINAARTEYFGDTLAESLLDHIRDYGAVLTDDTPAIMDTSSKTTPVYCHLLNGRDMVQRMQTKQNNLVATRKFSKRDQQEYNKLPDAPKEPTIK